MKKPKDPRSFLLVPEKTITKDFSISLYTGHAAGAELKFINELWANELGTKKFIKINCGPFVHNGTLRYNATITNQKYDEELLSYYNAISKYEHDLKQYELAQAASLRRSKDNLEEKITRAEHRLANLLALKDNKKIPYPNE